MNNKQKHEKVPEDKPVSASILKEYAKAFGGIDIGDVEEVETPVLKDLHDEFSKRVPDPRVPEQVHFTLADIVLIVLLGVLSNCNEWSEIETFAKEREDWLKKFLTLEYGVPSDTTIQRVISLIDVQMVYDIGLSYFLKCMQMAVSNARAHKAAEEENIGVNSVGRRDKIV